MVSANPILVLYVLDCFDKGVSPKKCAENLDIFQDYFLNTMDHFNSIQKRRKQLARKRKQVKHK